MPALSFEVEKRLDGTLARAGRLTLPHGVVETPVFMPVGTKATVKALTPEDLDELGAQIILGNAYHLYMRPGAELVEEFGGLHGFSGWHKPFLTDSGGFQVFSLGFGMEHGVGKLAKIFPGEGPAQPSAPRLKTGEKLCKVDDDGVTFRSHIDGSKHRFTPEVSIDIQQKLGADVILAFDECTSPLSGYAYTKRALGRTHRWARQSLEAKTSAHQALFGIVQGGAYEDLRRESAGYINDLCLEDGRRFEGFAIGGSLGESKGDMHRILEWVCPLLDEGKPRHLLGIGEPEDLFECIERGADMFDCVAPTRIARHGALFTLDGKINIRNLKFRHDKGPVDADCGCTTCRRYTRGYLRHLFLADELLFYRLASIHNLYFIVHLTKRIRASILDGGFMAFKESFLTRFLASRKA